MTRVGVFHPGTQHSWQTALAFQEVGQLRWYATSVFYSPDRWPYRIERFVPEPLATRLNRNFRRRHSPALEAGLVRQFGAWEWVETGSRRVGAEALAHWANRRGNASFGGSVIRLVQREPVDVLWGYDTSSLEVFRWAKQQGIRCVLDQTIGHCAAMNRVMLAEQKRHPDFFLASYTPFSPNAIARQDEEAALADMIVVGSDSCARAMIEHGCAASKIRILPYGYDETLFPGERPVRPPTEGRPLRFLFVGSVHPRKGIAALLQAFDRLPGEQAALTLVGRLEIPEKTFARYSRRVNHLGSLSRPDVVKHFVDADCFVFPSLFEGSALVLHEAAAAGLGIVQSAAAGDGVRDGSNGTVIAEVSVESVTAAVASIVDDRRRLAAWQGSSWERRLERTWQRYRQGARTLVAA